MNIDIVYRLIFIGIELAVLGIALSIIYQGRYLVAPEEKKLSRAKDMKRSGVVLLCFGFGYPACWLLALGGYLRQEIFYPSNNRLYFTGNSRSIGVPSIL